MVGNGARRLLPLGPDQQADGIGDEMASATFDLFARIRDARPATLCVSTGWLSMTRADRLGARRFILLRLRRVIAQHLAQMLSGVISVHSLCLDVCST
jgi:hypothetical protein